MGLLDFAKTGADILQRNFGVDVTPGMNLTKDAGGGIPFVEQNTQGRYTAPQVLGAKGGTNAGGNIGGGDTTGDGSVGNAVLGGGGTGGASRAPAYSQEDLAYLDSQMGNLNNQYGRTDTTLRDALDAVLQNYNKELGGANLTRGRNIEDFNTKTQVSEQGRGRELGKVDTNARMLANSLRQRLGLGAGASSAQNVAGEAVARQASEQRGDVLGDYAANFMELDTNKRRSEEDYNSMLKELDTQKLQREGGVRGDIETQRNSIRENQGKIAGEKAKLLGGGYTGVRSAMAPYDAKIAGGESLIDSIYSKYAAKYNVNPLQTRNTNLRDYATDNVAVRDQAQGGEEYSPYKNPFAKEEEQQPLGY